AGARSGSKPISRSSPVPLRELPLGGKSIAGPYPDPAPTLPAAEPAPALLVRRERLFERAAVEVGPELVAEHELRVGALPEQEVRNPLLAAGADQEVGIVHLRRVEPGPELLVGPPVEAACGVDDLRPAAVVEGHEQGDPAV